MDKVSCIRFLLNNAHRSKKASIMWRRKIIEDSIDVLFIQEPQVNKNGEICHGHAVSLAVVDLYACVLLQCIHLVQQIGASL